MARACMLAALVVASIAASGCTDDDRGEAVSGVGCGDGILVAGEACDDGNTRGFDGCNERCELEFCGDGITHIDEECDGGAAMVLGVADVCRPGCLAAFCGDGTVDSGEVCDGEAGIVDGVCAPDCKSRTCILGAELPSLRLALELNACTGIVVPAGTFGAGGTITESIEIRGEPGAILDASEGAITVAQGATVTMSDVVIQDGDGEQGGAIRNNGTLVLEGVTLQNNRATGGEGLAALGGAIHTTGDLTLDGCVLRDNTAQGGQAAGVARGGALYQADGQTRVVDTSFERNFATGEAQVASEGGAVFVNRGAFDAESTTFNENEAVCALGAATGGAVAGANATFALEDVVFRLNASTSQTLATGGALTLNGGSLRSDVMRLTQNSVVADAALGGGAELIGANVTLGAGVVVEENTASSPASPPFARGGGIHIDHSIVRLDGAAIDGNMLPVGGAGAGVYVIAANEQTVTLDAQGVSFANNRIVSEGVVVAEGFGAALYVRASEDGARATATLAQCSLLNNSIDLAGAETADAWGAGFFVDAAAGNAEARLLLVDSRVEGNTLTVTDSAFGSARGAAGYIAAVYEFALSEARLVRTAVTDHSASVASEDDAEAWGGALYVLASEDDARASLIATNSAILRSSVFAETPAAPAANVRLWGGALAVYAVNGATSSASLHHTTVVDSRVSAVDVSQREGALVHLYSVNEGNVSLLLADAVVADLGGAPACTVRGTAASESSGATLSDAALDCNGGLSVLASELSFAAEASPRVDFSLQPGTPGTAAASCNDDTGARLMSDVRGVARPAVGPCDSGAYERRAE